MLDNDRSLADNCDELKEFTQMFIDDTTEQLDALVEVLLQLEQSPQQSCLLDESFRLVHSIKGSSALMGFDNLTILTHRLENQFERLRSGSQLFDAAILDFVLQCIDFLRGALAGIREGRPVACDPSLLDRLVALESQQANGNDHHPSAAQCLVRNNALASDAADKNPVSNATSQDLQQTTESKRAKSDIPIEMTLLEEIQQINLSSEKNEKSLSPIDGSFILSCLPESSNSSDILGDINLCNTDQSTVPAEYSATCSDTVRVDVQRLDKLMNLAGELVVNRARFVQIADQMSEMFKKSNLANNLRDLCESVHQYFAFSDEGVSSNDRSGPATPKKLEILEQIDALNDYLPVLESGRRSYLQLVETIDQLSRVSHGLQKTVLDTRMVPIAPLFNKFRRTVRDIAQELNKKVRLELRGERTELDKRMIDALGDPLVHLVRNAIDHGLESEEARIASGKPAIGTLALEAIHSGNHVLIFVSDDGRGLNLEKIKKRAIERQLVSAVEADSLNEYQVEQFIWAPGFSTADTVSDISGRGVGMDIVRTRIRELNGTIEVSSIPGQSTTFVIRLPLTLAIIRCLVFRLKHGTFAAPLENAREIISVRSKDLLSIHGRKSFELRGEFIPLIELEELFHWHAAISDDPKTETDLAKKAYEVVVLTTLNKKIGLVVTGLNGCQDLVVKSLDENFTHVRGLAGASILGDGSVCQVLDVVSCIDMIHENFLSTAKQLKTRQGPSVPNAI